MLDIIKRIAARSAPIQWGDSGAPGHSRQGGSYPAVASDLAPSSRSVPSWEAATAASVQARITEAERLPAGAAAPRSALEGLFAELGSHIWRNRSALRDRSLHFELNNSLIAVLDPERRWLHLRNAAAAEYSRSSVLRHTPIVATLRPLAAATPKSEPFTGVGMYDLLWAWGQRDTEATSEMPPQARTHAIQLRRMPQVAPEALQMRHLALIYVFSGGPRTFNQLFRAIEADHARWLVADLTSLYLAGCLAFLPPEQGVEPGAVGAPAANDANAPPFATGV
jgi:hypothetical protein